MGPEGVVGRFRHQRVARTSQPIWQALGQLTLGEEGLGF